MDARLAEKLRDIRFCVQYVLDRHRVEPSQPKSILKRISRLEAKEYQQAIGMQERINQEIQRATAGYAQKKSLIDVLNDKEWRIFPHILMKLPALLMTQGMNDLFQVIQGTGDKSFYTRKKALKNLAYVYFSQFDQNPHYREIRQFLLKMLREAPELFKGIEYVSKHPEFLEETGPQKMGIHFAGGIESYLRSIVWPTALQYQRFVYRAILSFFKTKQSAESYANVFWELSDKHREIAFSPRLVEALILAIQQTNNQEFRDKVRTKLLSEMGDPRNESNLAWNKVNYKALSIFLQWLKLNDLNLFFEIISKSVQNNFQNRNMWAPRKRFWEQFVDDMYYTRVFLGEDAQNIVRHNRLHGKLSGYGKLTGDKTKSLFMFSIGKYVFIEASGNGKVRMWKKGEEPLPFFENGYDYNYSTDVVHAGKIKESTSHNGEWQDKVYGWLRKYCRVYRDLRYY